MPHTLILRAPPDVPFSFVGLKTSEASQLYNCLAWALDPDAIHGRRFRIWYPGFGMYWPTAVEGAYDLGAVNALLEAQGWAVGATDTYDREVHKIAVFAKDDEFTHIARMIMGDQTDDGPNNTCQAGLWTSKLGDAIDATHELVALTSQKYEVRYGALEGIYSRGRTPRV